MLKFNSKLILSTSTAAALAMLTVGCMGNTSTDKVILATNQVNGKATIDGGNIYPVINGKTGPYYVNPQVKAIAPKLYNGRIPTANELAAWDKDVMADGTGLPEGSGTAEEGSDIYDEKCASCHGDFGSGSGTYPALSKGNAYEVHKTLKNNRWKDPEADGPVRVFGSYWPQVSTLFWYIQDGMPHPFSKSLTDDEVYALVAYILNVNEMKIDGVEVDDNYVLDREKFLKIKMPNRDGFEPNIAGPHALDDVRAYYANPANFGGQKVKANERCMKNCQEKTARTIRIKNGGIKDFLPPLSDVRDLPAEKKGSLDVAAAYENSCAMCHSNGSGPAPGSKSEWAPYLADGKDSVYDKGIKGTNSGMPAKGGSSLSDADFKMVVDYLINGK